MWWVWVVVPTSCSSVAMSICAWCWPSRCFVGLGEQQELLDEVFEAVGLLRGQFGNARPRRAIGVGQADLQGGADGGEWAAQLVEASATNRALAAGGVVEAVEHLVHGFGEVPDFI